MSRVSDAPLGGTPKQWESWSAQVADSMSYGEWGPTKAVSWPSTPTYASVVLGAGQVSILAIWDSGYSSGAIDFKRKVSGILHLSNSDGSTVEHILVKDGLANLPSGSYKMLVGNIAQVLEVR